MAKRKKTEDAKKKRTEYMTKELSIMGVYYK